MPELTSSPGLDAIQTPRIQSNGLVALLTKILRVADEHKLPPHIARRVERIRATSAVLEKALAGRHATTEEGALTKVEADANVDEAVKALAGFLESLSRLPDDLGGAKARKLFKALFGDGDFGWLMIAFDDQWVEVKARLDLIASEKLDKVIAELGGKPVLDNLKAAQEAYGKALGITADKAPKPLPPAIRDPFLASLDALRRYMAVVIGHGADADEKPEAGELAALLLAPIEEIRLRNAARPSPAKAKADESNEDEDGDRPTPAVIGGKPGADDGSG